MNHEPLERWLSSLCDLDACRQTIMLTDVDEPSLVTCAEAIARFCLAYLREKGGHLSVFLTGPLGAGKTRFCQAFIPTFTQAEVGEVESPTYAYMIPYEGPDGFILQHFDLYRLQSEDHLKELGLDEKWSQKGLSLIEWPQSANLLAPWPRLKLTIAYESAYTRSLKGQWELKAIPQPARMDA